MKMPTSSEFFLFGEFRLDRAGGGLFRRDDHGVFAPVTIGSRALDLLAALIERRGDVVAKEEIMAAVWPKMTVEEHNLFVQISALRAILDKKQSAQSCIQTVAGRGYRFIAPVARCAGGMDSSPGPHERLPLFPSDGAKPPFPLAEARPPEPQPPSISSAERRQLTVMVCDLVGSVGLAATRDLEDWRDLVKAYLDEASKLATALGGHVLTRLGNGLTVLFGYPEAQENDAERAVRAALAIQRALAELNARNESGRALDVAVRVGLDSGPVIVEPTGEVFGEAPNIAARVQAFAEPGAVVVTANVHRQVAGLFVAEDKGAHELQGVAEPVTLYCVMRASGGRRWGAARPLTPFIGREEELGLLTQRWGRAQAGEGQFVFSVGEPGIGKSRLVEEFRAKLAGTSHTWVEWSALQLLQNTPLHPLAEWSRIRFEADSPAEQRLADLENTLGLVGLDPAEYAPLLAPLVDIPLPAARAPNLPPEELRRRQLEAVVAWVLAGARSQAVAFAFEDLQWADPTSLDLMRALAMRGAQAPLLIIVTARPEFLPPWSIHSHHSVISLTPLDRAQVRQMVGEIAARHVLSRQVVEGVTERTGGVPLFVEEVTRLLLERGEAGGLQAIPPTLQQSLAARLDRVGEAREVAQIGAVLGRDFSYALLAAVAAPVGGVNEPAVQAVGDRGLQSALDRLVDADLLIVQGAGAQATYRFKHALIQDAAYESLLKSRRQALHRRAGEILRDKPESAAAAPEVIAHHFTEAGLDDRAIEWWGKAGDQALRRSAFQEAIAHLGKAIAMADKAGEGAPAATPSARLKLQTNLARAVMWSKGFGSEEAQAAYARARELVAKVDDPAERFATYYGQWINTGMRSGLAAAQDISQIFLNEAMSSASAPEIATAHRMIGLTLLTQGDLVDAKGHLDEALRVYDPQWGHDDRFRLGFEPGLTAMAYLASTEWLLGNAARARNLIEDAVARSIDAGHVPTLGNSYFFAAQLEVLRGDPIAALKMARTATDYARENDLGLHWAMAKIYLGWARARLGEHESGITELKQALAAHTETGYKTYITFFAGLLAQVEAEGNQHREALSRIAEALTLANEISEHWVDSFLQRIRGEILLKLDPAAAEQAFIAAIAIAQQQKAKSFELHAALSLAKLYQSTTRPAAARAILAPALKGFSPTPEMPAIADALALMHRLA
jgi:class 3 adenylate cyclase/DNA-binding winged helix-turn-helix (wHTH) protein/tetratricopeptide (TPR) repeat protein